MIIAPFLELGPGDWHLFNVVENMAKDDLLLSLIHISEPTRPY